MPLTTLDFTEGLDFTGLTSATAADHNSLINLATPKDEGTLGGKGLIIATLDSALNTPVVPDATYVLKWKYYLWIRKPHSTATSTLPIVYAWDDNAEFVATYLKWRVVGVDLTTLEAQVSVLDSDLATVATNVTAALNIANAANTLANTANNLAVAADAKADAAITVANALSTTATQALTKANDAITQANTAVAAVSSKRLPKDSLIPGTAGQMLRVNSAGTEVEWFNSKDTYVKCYANAKQTLTATEQWVAIAIQAEEQDTGNLCSITSNKITLAAGTYYVNVVIPVDSLNKAQALLGNNLTKTVLLKSTLSEDTDSYTLHLSGIITLTASTPLDLYIYRSQSGTLSHGSAGIDGAVAGLPAGYANTAETYVYTTFEAWKIG